MPRKLYALIAVVLVVYVATVLASGTPAYLIPAALVAVLVGGYFAFEHWLGRRHMQRHGDTLAAMRDDTDWPIPSAHLGADDATDLGDTTEVHSEINPHDLPPDHPGRQAAQAQADTAGTHETSGNAEGGAGGDFEGREDRTTQRTGEPQRSARFAKTAGSPREDGQHAEGRTSTPGQRP